MIRGRDIGVEESEDGYAVTTEHADGQKKYEKRMLASLASWQHDSL